MTRLYSSKSFVLMLLASQTLPQAAILQAQEVPAAEASAIAGDLYQFPPEMPAELVRAARTTQLLDRHGDSRAFLRRVLEAELSAGQFRALRRQVGPEILLGLRQDPQLSPEAEQLLQAINAAALTDAPSAAELQSLIEALGTSGSRAADAVSELLSAGDAAVKPLLAADPATPAGRTAERVLRTYASQLKNGLLEELSAADDQARLRILSLLTTVSDRRLALRLVRWQFDPEASEEIRTAAAAAVTRCSGGTLMAGSRQEGVSVLISEVRTLLRQSAARFGDDTGRLDAPAIDLVAEADKSVLSAQVGLRQAEDDFAGKFISRTQLRAAKRTLLTATQSRGALNEQISRRRFTRLVQDAQRLMKDALVIAPDDATTRSLALVSESALAPAVLTADSQPTAAADQPAEVVIAALDEALKLSHGPAAVELLRAVSLLNAETLQTAGSVLRSAIHAADPRVRQMAARICENTRVPAVRAGLVSQVLEQAREGSKLSEAVVVTPDDALLSELQFALQELGYSATAAETPPEGFDLAAAALSCDLVLLSAEAPIWPLAVTVTNLRADLRTRLTPIVVFGPARFKSRVEELNRLHSGVWFVENPVGVETLSSKLRELNLPTPILTAEDRAFIKSRFE